ncbi:hypothetical protein CJ030_MR2G027125 [Morella rubra]|uniref:Leucine-rich repeat-containing N-terminal plant-type domain-containing protein n=1 Tax=Morella rubra TaxID=262757 RepID=A0A6A1W8I7_9ROSI|nr:hypothetical protein CJ030_MR2G027125 [Morella rubra]
MAGTHTFTSIAHLLLLFSFCPLRPPYSQAAIEPASATDTQTFRCSEMERKALLSFKQSLLDPSGRLSSWVGEDCCKWIGVGCDSRTGHVVMLDLKNPLPMAKFDDEYEWREALNKSSLGGKISPSLLDLKNLSYLDLSLNDFTGNKIPEFLGSLESLRYLNLSFSFFGGVIPPHLGNLSRLQYLDLESFYYFGGLDVKNLKWLVGFRSLKHLNLGRANLTKVPDWLEAVNTLSSLLELHLSGVNSSENSTLVLDVKHDWVPPFKLDTLYLDKMPIGPSFPAWLQTQNGLLLSLEDVVIFEPIPENIEKLWPNLEYLNLASNSIIGEIPRSVGL